MVVTQGHLQEAAGTEKGKQGWEKGEEGSVWVTHSMGALDLNAVPVAARVCFCDWHSFCSLRGLSPPWQGVRGLAASCVWERDASQCPF